MVIMTEEINPEEVKVEKKPKREINKWKIISMILIVILAVSLLIFGTGITGMAVSSSDNVIDSEEAANKAIEFINENLIQPGTSVSLVSVEEFEGLYNVTVSYQGRDIPIFVTKDGTHIFLSAPVDITEELPKPPETQEQQPEDVIKTDRPKVELFIWSYCPYGVQAQGPFSKIKYKHVYRRLLKINIGSMLLAL